VAGDHEVLPNRVFPVPQQETIEIMAFMEAADESKNQAARR